MLGAHNLRGRDFLGLMLQPSQCVMGFQDAESRSSCAFSRELGVHVDGRERVRKLTGEVNSERAEMRNGTGRAGSS